MGAGLVLGKARSLGSQEGLGLLRPALCWGGLEAWVWENLPGVMGVGLVSGSVVEQEPVCSQGLWDGWHSLELEWDRRQVHWSHPDASEGQCWGPWWIWVFASFSFPHGERISLYTGLTMLEEDNVKLSFLIFFSVPFIIYFLHPSAVNPHLESWTLVKVFCVWIVAQIDVSGRGRVLDISILPSCCHTEVVLRRKFISNKCLYQEQRSQTT